MKLIENYSLQSGQKIKTISLLEKFYPISLDKFILIQPFSKSSKSYDLWQDVLKYYIQY